jgi:hypothetical protein
LQIPLSFLLSHSDLDVPFYKNCAAKLFTQKRKKENPVKEQSFLGTLRERSNFTYSTREEGQC